MRDRLANLLLSRLLSYWSRSILAGQSGHFTNRNVLCIGLFQQFRHSPPPPPPCQGCPITTPIDPPAGWRPRRRDGHGRTLHDGRAGLGRPSRGWETTAKARVSETLVAPIRRLIASNRAEFGVFEPIAWASIAALGRPDPDGHLGLRFLVGPSMVTSHAIGACRGQTTWTFTRR